MHSTTPAPALTAEAAAIVRAIRRALHNPPDVAGLVRFTVTDIYAFAEKLAREGVVAPDDGR